MSGDLYFREGKVKEREGGNAMSGILEYKCPCCGGAITFDSRAQKMKCPYCDTEFDMDTLRQFEEEEIREDSGPDWRTAEKEREELRDEGDGLVSYVCESCGGEIIAEQTMAASRCPCCDNPVIVMKQLSGMAKPDLVIPFKLDKKQAKENLKRHLKNKMLLPRSFRTESKLEEVKGVYVPFWLFDCEAQADLRYRATRIRHWTSGDYNYTETSHYLVSRTGDLAFDYVPVDGSEKMANDLMESIEPFRYEDAVDFQTAYLSGYLADKYDVSSSECYARANERIAESTERVFADTVIGYATCIPEKKDIRLRQGRVSYALLPVWILHTKYRGKLYTFAMNGQTGKFVGDLPMDAGRAFAAAGSAFLSAALIALLVMMVLL